MKTWIILLRGINVGGNNKLPMKDLRSLLETNKFENVQTYIQSGNVVCEYPTKPDQEVGALIKQKFGFKPSCFVLSAEDLNHIAEASPYPKDAGKAVHFFFFHKAPQSFDSALLDSLKAENEAYQLIGSVFYLHAPDGIGRSKLVDKIPKAFAKADMTARNLNTVNKLLEMVG